MGFNGDVLVGRGEAFTAVLGRIWNREEEVIETWPLCDGWQAVYVRSPAEPDELRELAEAADSPVLACEVFESSTGYIRAVSAAGYWEARLNPEDAAARRAWNAVDERIGGNLYPEGTPQDHAEVKHLTAQYAAEFDAQRSATRRAAIAWAAESGLRADADRVESALAAHWGTAVREGFLAFLSAVGIDPA